MRVCDRELCLPFPDFWVGSRASIVFCRAGPELESGLRDEGKGAAQSRLGNGLQQRRKLPALHADACSSISTKVYLKIHLRSNPISAVITLILVLPPKNPPKVAHRSHKSSTKTPKWPAIPGGRSYSTAKTANSATKCTQRNEEQPVTWNYNCDSILHTVWWAVWCCAITTVFLL